MIFKVAYKKDNNMLVKIAGLDPVTEKKDKKDGTWANCSANVYNWAKKSFKEGEEVIVEYTEKNGQYNVTRITKGSGDSVQTKAKNTSSPTCADCGKELKDDKYSKCYTCNKKNPDKTTTTSKKKSYSKSYSKSPEDKEQIRRLSVLRAVAEAVQVMTGQINDIGVLGDMMEVLYNKFYQKVSE